MKKTIILFAFLFFMLTIKSQTVVTQSDIENHLQVGNLIVNYSDTIGATVDIGAPGENTWDFENHQYHLEFEAESIDPTTSPAYDTFPSSTHTTYSNPPVEGGTGETWSHLIVDDGIYGETGFLSMVEVDASGITSEIEIESDPPGVIMELPLTYQDEWSVTNTETTSVTVDGVPVQTTEIEQTSAKTVDGYGTLTMPDGTVEEVLRIKIEAEQTVDEGGTPITEERLSFMFVSASGATLTVVAADPNAPDNGTIEANQVNWNYGNGAPSSVDKIEELANDFTLAQNYPNPFNPATNIQYSIPKASDVSLKVYDVLGNEVTTLVDEFLSPGTYNSKFDASNLASGIYFYTLKAGSFSATKKLMLVR